mmetsp:Transcript_10211/g.34047  ORF Transcript_10211/g.34047 Transcript_10211/m.34047 type:complete len:257 (-) Transcript_10211:427-1197(-)
MKGLDPLPRPCVLRGRKMRLIVGVEFSVGRWVGSTAIQRSELSSDESVVGGPVPPDRLVAVPPLVFTVGFPEMIRNHGLGAGLRLTLCRGFCCCPRVVDKLTHHLLCRRSLRWILSQARPQQVLNKRAVTARQRRILPHKNLLDHCPVVASMEGKPPLGADLVQQNSTRPYVRLGVVGLTIAKLRRQVQRGSYHRDCHWLSCVEPLCYPKVSEFWYVLLADEDVVRLEISVQDLLLVEVCEAVDDVLEDPHRILLG